MSWPLCLRVVSCDDDAHGHCQRSSTVARACGAATPAEANSTAPVDSVSSAPATRDSQKRRRLPGEARTYDLIAPHPQRRPGGGGKAMVLFYNTNNHLNSFAGREMGPAATVKAALVSFVDQWVGIKASSEV